jgi:hypothetical protein
MGGIPGFRRPSVPPPPPPVEMPKVPVVDNTIVERNAADMRRRRRGRAATVLAGDTGTGQMSSNGTTPVLGG